MRPKIWWYAFGSVGCAAVAGSAAGAATPADAIFRLGLAVALLALLFSAQLHRTNDRKKERDRK